LASFTLPSFVSYDCVSFAPGDESRFASIDLPAQIERAVAKRRLEFLAGRSCAQEALGRLLGRPFVDPIAIGVDRAPVWPAGIVGAITHAEGFAAAAVARATDTRGLGIDSEPIVAAGASSAVIEQATVSGELEALGGSGMDQALLLTLVFSAKESLFKCLYPQVRRYFDFQDAAVVDVSAPAQTFAVELRTSMGGLLCGARLIGRFALIDGLVHTGIWLKG
jgi:enterobactin synthetase component D